MTKTGRTLSDTPFADPLLAALAIRYGLDETDIDLQSWQVDTASEPELAGRSAFEAGMPHFQWFGDGIVDGEPAQLWIGLTPEASYSTQDGLITLGTSAVLPETILLALPGRRATTLVDEPLLAEFTITSVERGQNWTRFHLSKDRGPVMGQQDPHPMASDATGGSTMWTA